MTNARCTFDLAQKIKLGEVHMDSTLKVEDLKVSFHGENNTVQAVNGVSFQIEKGEILGLVGESGSGKSVTSLSIMRLLSKQSSVTGKVEFEGENLLDKSERKMRSIRGADISMIFQDPMTSLNPVLTIEKQLQEVIKYHTNLNKQEIQERLYELMELVKIPDGKRRLKEYPHQMSGGIRQRIMIAIALACNPKLLIADEPTTALDVTVQAQILSLIKDLQNTLDTAILMISHDLGVIAQVADNIAVMYSGQIVEYADVETLFSSPKHPYTKGLLATIPRIDVEQAELIEIPGMVPEMSGDFIGCRFYERCSQAMDQCKQQDIDLVDSKNSKVRCLLYS